MKTKKLLLLLLMLMVVFTFSACGGTDEPAADEQGGGAADEGGFPEEVFLLMNGNEVRIGDNMADFEGKLGDEIKPSETIQPCDPNFETATVEYYFNGVQITTNEEGVIATISLDERNGETDAAFAGKVKLHDSMDGIKEVLGEPEEGNEDELFVNYYYGSEDDPGVLLFYKDEEGNNTMTGFVMSRGSLTMVKQD